MVIHQYQANNVVHITNCFHFFGEKGFTAVLFSKAATYNCFIEALLKILIDSLSVKHQKIAKNAPKNFPQLKFKTSRNHSHLRSWNQSTFPVFVEKLLNKCLIMKIIAEKKEAGRVLKVENCGRVGNSDTRKRKWHNLLNIGGSVKSMCTQMQPESRSVKNATNISQNESLDHSEGRTQYCKNQQQSYTVLSPHWYVHPLGEQNNTVV